MNRNLLIFFSIVLITACTLPFSSKTVAKIDMPSDIPNPVELENKITKLYESETNHDWRTWYSLASSLFKKEYSIEKFERVHWVANPEEEYSIVSWGIKNITSITRPEEKLRNAYSVAVEMDIFVKVKGQSEPIKIKDATDYWVYFDNSWGWMWRGYPKD